MTQATSPDFRSVVRAALGERSLLWLSKESGVPYASLHPWLTDGKTMSSDHLQRLAATLGLTLRRARR